MTRGRSGTSAVAGERESAVTSLTLASLPVLRRPKHGKQQKMRRRDTPVHTHTHTYTHEHARTSTHTHTVRQPHKNMQRKNNALFSPI